MGQIANQMLIEAIFKIKEKLKEKKAEKKNETIVDGKENEKDR